MPFTLEEKSFDVVVVGGGLAGVCAAISASRHGAKTALLEARPVLGGNSCSLIQVQPLGAASFNSWARETGIIDEMTTEHQKRAHLLFRNALISSQWDLVLYEWVKAEENLTLYLNTVLYDVEMSSKESIRSIECLQVGSEKRYKLSAAFFIDCTGDGTMAGLAGADFRMGRESREEFNESSIILPEKSDDQTQGSSLMFRSVDIGKPVEYRPPSWAARFPSEESLYKRHHDPFVFPNGQKSFFGWWWIEIGAPYNTIYQNEEIRDELLKQLLGVWDHIKNHCVFDAKSMALDWVGTIPGKRESRRVLGDHILTEQDIRGDKLFLDRVAYGGWSIDVHTMGGMLAKNLPPERLTGSIDLSDNVFVEPYSIPFRCLYSRNILNLMLAGRDISVTHVAFGTTRLMRTCAIMGQAVGTAAALCKKLKTTPRGLVQNQDYVKMLQQTLLKDDCFIPDMPNKDPEDMALKAKASASSYAKLTLSPSEGEVSLGFDRCQVFPVSQNYVETVSFWLHSKSNRDEEVTLEFEPIRSIWSLNETVPKEPLKATVTVPSGYDGWVKFPIRSKVEPSNLYRINVFSKENLYLRKSNPLPGVVAGWKKPNWKRYKHEGAGIPGLEYNGRPTNTTYHQFDFVYAMELDPPSHPFTPENVVNGYSRPYKWANIWISDPAEPLPQWLMLDFGKEVTFNTVYMTFDNNLNVEFGILPQFYVFPECIRDYVLKVSEGRSFKTIGSVEGNYHRRRIHKFERVQAQKLLIEVYKTNGDPSARIYEVRVYNER